MPFDHDAWLRAVLSAQDLPDEEHRVAVAAYAAFADRCSGEVLIPSRRIAEEANLRPDIVEEARSLAVNAGLMEIRADGVTLRQPGEISYPVAPM